MHVPAQLVIRCYLRHLRSCRLSVGVPLGGRSARLKAATTGGSVATQFPRDRRRGTADATSDVTNPTTLRAQDGDFFSFGKRQIAPRYWGQADRRHASTFAEPFRSNRLGYASLQRRILTGQPAGDRLPEPTPMLAPSRRGTPRRPHRRTSRTMRPTTFRCSHRNSSSLRRCDDRLNLPWARRWNPDRHTEMPQDAADHHRLLDERHEAQPPAASRACQHIEAKRPRHQRRPRGTAPGAGGPGVWAARGGRFSPRTVIASRRLRARDHETTPRRPGAEHPAIEEQVDAWPRDQHGQPTDERDRIEDEPAAMTNPAWRLKPLACA